MDKVNLAREDLVKTKDRLEKNACDHIQRYIADKGSQIANEASNLVRAAFNKGYKIGYEEWQLDAEKNEQEERPGSDIEVGDEVVTPSYEHATFIVTNIDKENGLACGFESQSGEIVGYCPIDLLKKTGRYLDFYVSGLDTHWVTGGFADEKEPVRHEAQA